MINLLACAEVYQVVKLTSRHGLEIFSISLGVLEEITRSLLHPHTEQRSPLGILAKLFELLSLEIRQKPACTHLNKYN